MATSEDLQRATKDLAALAEELGVEKMDVILARYGVEYLPLADFAFRRAWDTMRALCRDESGPVAERIAALFMHGVIVGLALAEEMSGPTSETLEAAENGRGATG